MITVAEAEAAIDKIVAGTRAAGFVAAHRMDGCRPRVPYGTRRGR